MLDRAVDETLNRTLEKGLEYLAQTQDPTGYWSDFWLKAGTSDAWVTAYTGVLLWEITPRLRPPVAELARACINKAADWLLGHIGPQASWGYNVSTVPDADSTAWGVMLLARLKRTIPAGALDFLLAHQAADGLFRTYRFSPEHHHWGQPCVDVSLTAAMALVDTQVWSPAQSIPYWHTVIAPNQTQTGTFTGYWWAHPHFPTWLASRLWQRLGKPAMKHDWPLLQGDAPFFQACGGLLKSSGELLSGLLAQQQADGSWASVPSLRVPSSHKGLLQVRPKLSQDARRIFTTVTVLAAIASCDPLPLKLEQRIVSHHSAIKPRSAYGQACDQLVHRVSTLAGFNPQQRVEAIRCFQRLTQESLASPEVWPSAQLSALSMGQPLEFSVAAEAKSNPSLRYTCEVGNPVLPAAERVKTGLASLEETATQLGCGALWQQLTPLWQRLQDGAATLPAGTRFCLWGGVSQAAGELAVLKVYVNSLLGGNGDAHGGLRSQLAAAKIPYTGELQWLCETLKKIGFPQEIGYGLRGDGQWGAKIYYEFFGWRPILMDEISTGLDFPVTPSRLVPVIPGVLSELLAQKRRSGLSFRIHPVTGKVLELTTTAAFPVQLISASATHEKILTWLQTQSENTQDYARLFENLFSKPSPKHHRSHSLFTRTINLAGQTKTTLYLRPIIKTGKKLGKAREDGADSPVISQTTAE
ncbi:MAG: hypothetical protein AAF921_03415 [Cyanobacteria bacterium P01_D01_bin.44]